MNQFNIEVDWPNSLVHSLHSLRALNLTVDRFQTNDTLIYSHGLLTIAVCKESLFFFRFREGSARARERRSRGKREKRGWQPEFSRLVPSVTRVVI